MKGLTIFVLLALSVFFAGCSAGRPITESEFRGFCYNNNGSFQFDCDTISLCNEYLAVLNTPQRSLRECRAACQSIYTAQARRHLLSGCYNAASHARGWCQRYCAGAYQQ